MFFSSSRGSSSIIVIPAIVAKLYSKTDKLNTVIPQAKIQEAIQILAETAKPKRIILFGSYATGQAHEGSDLDFLVIKETIKDYEEEIVDLELALLPLGISKDILLASTKDIREWGSSGRQWSFVLGVEEGRVVYDSP